MTNRWGAIPHAGGRWTISTWAPSARAVKVEVDGDIYEMDRTTDGWWQTRLVAAQGSAYRFLVDDVAVPDPASRWQVGDVHGASVLIDHQAYQWTSTWFGRPWAEAAIYEIHIGTFTPQGTFAAAMDKLAELAELGFTAIEIMPIGQWSGDRGWGYDGVLPYTLHPAYGTPDEFKAFIACAQSLGMMVLLDFVMNHFGVDGAHLHSTTPEFFARERETPWGAAIDFDRPAVRAFWIECASMWISHYRLDGLRFDAVHQITGPGANEFLQELAETLRSLDLERPIHLITEDERNEPGWRETGLYDATWNDDFHHAVHAALTGESHDYYASYAVDPIADLCRALEHGQVEEGQDRKGRDERRGQPSGHLPPTAFVNAIQTHDQIGNRPQGERLITLASPRAVEVAYALLLVAPYIPMIMMGEERGDPSPFLFFADFDGKLAERIRDGRADEIGEADAAAVEPPDPLAMETFLASKLSWKTDEAAQRWLDLTRQCLAFRRKYVVPLLKSGRVGKAQVRRIGAASIEARWPFGAGSLSLALNFGAVGVVPPKAHHPQFTLHALERDDYALSIHGDLA